MNERLERIERQAASLGVKVSRPTKNSRQFALSPQRTITYRCQGKGTMLIEARYCGVLEAQDIARDGRVHELLLKAAEDDD